MRFFLIFLLFSTLFLTAGTFSISQVQGQNQDTYSLQIQGLAWHRTILSILVITPHNESWWNPIYINSTLRAIGQWNDALSYFASNYTDYAYLSFLKLEPTVVNETKPGFDIYLSWNQSTLANTVNDIGLTSTSEENNAIISITTNLSTHTSHGDALVDGDMQNVALHELGHTLGLGHSNYTGDVMYPAYTLLGSARSISTLDAYGVATTFAWMSNQIKFYPVSEWLKGDPAILPSNIQYQYLPASAQNARPQTLQNNPVIQTLTLMGEILIHPDILAVVLLFTVILVIIALVPRRKRVTRAAS
jgi:hypothetical protein